MIRTWSTPKKKMSEVFETGFVSDESAALFGVRRGVSGFRR
jgi:hypothetical protein